MENVISLHGMVLCHQSINGRVNPTTHTELRCITYAFNCVEITKLFNLNLIYIDIIIACVHSGSHKSQLHVVKLYS